MVRADDEGPAEPGAQHVEEPSTGEHPGPGPVGGATDDESVGERLVEERAEGRPPEEADSDDPHGQAEAILADSEERLRRRAAAAEPPDG